MKNQTGIWLDFKDAYVVTFDEKGDAAVKHLHSEVTHPATKGGARSKSPWGPQFSPPDKKDLERAKHEEHHYFQQILESFDGDSTEEIVIFGPAEAKLGLKKEIESIKHYKPKLLGAFPSDYITQNQIVVLVRDFFQNPDKYHKKEKKEV
jgi:hypothetical protein